MGCDGRTIDRDALLRQLLDAHRAYYDVTCGYRFAGRTFPGYAEFHSHGERYVLSKKAKLWEVDAHEYLFFDTAPVADGAYLEELIAFMTGPVLGKVEPKPDHMASYLSAVVIADRADVAAPALVRRARFRKNFRLGLRGWADLRLAVIDLQGYNVCTNGQGKQMRGVLEANLAKAVAAAGDGKGE